MPCCLSVSTNGAMPGSKSNTGSLGTIRYNPLFLARRLYPNMQSHGGAVTGANFVGLANTLLMGEGLDQGVTTIASPRVHSPRSASLRSIHACNAVTGTRMDPPTRIDGRSPDASNSYTLLRPMPIASAASAGRDASTHVLCCDATYRVGTAATALLWCVVASRWVRTADPTFVALRSDLADRFLRLWCLTVGNTHDTVGHNRF